MRRYVFGAAVVCAFMASLLVGACSDKSGGDGTQVPAAARLSKTGDPIAQRPLSELEMDTLIVMKKELNVTRDQYWNNYGGVLGSDFMDLWYPPGNLTVTYAMYQVRFITLARNRTIGVFGRAPKPRLTVVSSSSLDTYREQTGNDWWHYSKIDGDQITLQPAAMLAQRSILPIATRREYFEWAILQLSDGRAPHWLTQGCAALLSEEEFVLEDQRTEYGTLPFAVDMVEIEQALDADTDRIAARRAGYTAFRMVRRLARDHGVDKLAAMVLGFGEGKNRDELSQDVYGMAWDDMIQTAQAWIAESGQ